MTLLVGPSGCGKTTLLSVIAGILDCDSGEVTIFGQRRHGDERPRADAVPRPEHRLRLPAVQPAARADRRRERGDPAGDRRLVEAAGRAPGRRGAGGARAWARSSRACPASSPAVRAASGDRAGPGPRAASPGLRRADRRARPRDRPDRHGAAARGGRPARPGRHRRHPRQPRLRLRRPDRPHGRRPDRRSRGATRRDDRPPVSSDGSRVIIVLQEGQVDHDHEIRLADAGGGRRCLRGLHRGPGAARRRRRRSRSSSRRRGPTEVTHDRRLRADRGAAGEHPDRRERPGRRHRGLRQEGRQVKKGEPLFRIDDRELKAQLAVREAELASAEAQLHKLKAAPRPEDIPPAEAAVEEAEARMDDAEAAHGPDRAALRAADDRRRATTTRTATPIYAAKATLCQGQGRPGADPGRTWEEDIEIARGRRPARPEPGREHQDQPRAADRPRPDRRRGPPGQRPARSVRRAGLE